MLFITRDGSHSMVSTQFGEAYHSRFGAVTESAHVFIGAGLRHVGERQPNIRVLETGFGTGLNALMTWREAERCCFQVHYTALELFPVSLAEAGSLNYPAHLEGDADDLENRLLRLHAAPWDEDTAFSDAFAMLKRQTAIETFESPSLYDLIYFDAFAPEAQPELWTEAVFRRMFDALAPGGVLVTYCAKGEVKRRMARAGFQVERLPGPPGKREMTRAWKLMNDGASRNHGFFSQKRTFKKVEKKQFWRKGQKKLWRTLI